MKVIKDSQGIALMVVVMLMAILLSITGATLLFSGLNLKSTSNYKSGNVGLNTADAGIQHALAVIPLGTNFAYGSGSTVVPTTPFVTASSGYTYTVTATNDPPTSSSTPKAILTSAATGPGGSKRVVRAYIARSTGSWVPPGAVHVPGSSSSDKAFDPSGTNWTVTGNDTNYDSTAGPKSAIVGITAIDPTFVESILGGLNGESKKQRVTGLGYVAGPPATPSVQQTNRIDDVGVVGRNFIDQVTATTCPPKCLAGLNYNVSTCPAASPCTLGTDASPQITYITGDSMVSLGGYTTGSGVLVLEADQVKLSDNFNFHGLVIHLQRSVATSDPELKFTIKGNGKIYGSLLLGPNNNALEFEIKDNSGVRYSSQAISMVNANWGSLLPQPPRLVAWSEVLQ